jgi:hypothetical protein
VNIPYCLQQGAVAMEIDDLGAPLYNPVARAQKAATLPECRESVPQFCRDGFEFGKRDTPSCPGRASKPLMEDCEKRGPFSFLEPNSFVDSIKVEAQDAFRCCERAVPFLEFFV